MKKQDENPVATKEIRGEATFSVYHRGPVLQMLIHGKPIAEAAMTTGKEYDALFDYVKANIKALARASPAATAATVTPSGPSTRNLASLPEPARLRDLLRSLAVLDAIMEPKWESRYYSFDPKWGSSPLGSMRNGEGDWFFALFTSPDSAVIKGFAHESEMTPFKRPNNEPWPGLADGVPDALAHARKMKEFPPEEVTFFAWHEPAGAWKIGPVAFPPGAEDPDGSAGLLELLDDNPASYARFASEYYERKVDNALVGAVYAGEPLTRAMIRKLNPKANVKNVLREAAEMGYPVAAEPAEQGKKAAAAPKTKRVKR